MASEINLFDVRIWLNKQITNAAICAQDAEDRIPAEGGMVVVHAAHFRALQSEFEDALVAINNAQEMIMHLCD